jgi:ABC-type Fe3+ transport system permease subunit
MVETELPGYISTELLIVFAVTTTILIAVHLFALMVSTCILPQVDAIASRHSHNSETVHQSPHRRMQKYIELAWIFSTCIGIVLFLVELAIICWIKFADVTPVTIKTSGNIDMNSSVDLQSVEDMSHENRYIAALAATVIIALIVLVFLLFAAGFYHYIVQHKYEVSSKAIAELQELSRGLEKANLNDDNIRRILESASMEAYADTVETDMCDDSNSEASSYHEAQSAVDETGV